MRSFYGLLYIAIFWQFVHSASLNYKIAEGTEFHHMHPHLPNIVRTLTPRAQLEQTSEFWLNNGKKFVADQIRKKLNVNTAKNIIFFLGDGMSVPTISAVRAYLGGEEKKFSFEDFSTVGMAKTYCVDSQVSDSATTATAYLNGVKANIGTVGVSAKVPYEDCQKQLDKSLYTTSIAKWAMDAGKWAGLVTTTRVTHASPSGVYAHSASRNWETDVDLLRSNCDPNLIDDITEQLVHGDVGSKLRVVLGGGRGTFLPNTTRDEEGFRGKRRDHKNLIVDWLTNNNNGQDNKSYVWNLDGLLNVNVSETDYLLGLFEPSHLQYHLDLVNKSLEHKKPSLTQLTAKAIELLSKNKNGYFLFVEGGKIDLAHHETKARKSLDETAEFSKAIDYARRAVSEEDTIILVTADHAHTMSYSGYPVRGNDIFGMAGISDDDNLPYMTLTYANGRGYENNQNQNGGRLDLRQQKTASKDFTHPSTLPLDYETHGGDDVTVHVNGPWSHLFSGTYEQHAIPHMLAYAACIGNGLKSCDAKNYD